LLASGRPVAALLARCAGFITGMMSDEPSSCMADNSDYPTRELAPKITFSHPNCDPQSYAIRNPICVERNQTFAVDRRSRLKLDRIVLRAQCYGKTH
jgi:hypothetical protein